MPAIDSSFLALPARELAGAALQRAADLGAEHADSYTFNPHKWLFTNFDCNVLWVADRAPLIASLSILPPYLRRTKSVEELIPWLYLKGISAAEVTRVVAGRPYAGLSDFWHRAQVARPVAEPPKACGREPASPSVSVARPRSAQARTTPSAADEVSAAKCWSPDNGELPARVARSLAAIELSDTSA